MAISATRVTRLGNYGGARQAYGNFAGKTLTAAANDRNPMIASIGKMMNR